MNYTLLPPWLVLLCWLAFVLLPHEVVVELALEDGPIENVGAAAFFVGSVVFFGAYLRSRGANLELRLISTERNLVYLVLALAFFFAAGEEISWGQRVFGWETPEAVASVNAQNETTIHNLDFFQEGISFSFWFNAFWFGLCVGVPLIDRWPPAHALLARLGIPIVSLWMGALLAANYVVFKWVGSPYESGSELRHAANELKETTIALIFVWVAWGMFAAERGDGHDRSG